LDPGLSTVEPLTHVNQFLFKARLVTTSPELSSPAAYEPIGLNDALIVDDLADSYCFEVEAIDIATGQTHVYPEQHCVARGDVPVEIIALELSPAFLDHDDCIQPPVDYEAAWCSANESDCAGELNGPCKLYRYACNNGPLPEWWRAAAERVPERNIPFRGPDLPRGERCAASSPGTASSGAGFLAVLSLALLAISVRRARRYQAQPSAPRSVTSIATGHDA
jgi:hypothetical protein